MYLDFRPLLRRTFAELSRKYPYPAISRGRIEGKASTRGLGDWLSQSLTFGNLAVAFGACFSRLQKASLGSDSGRIRQVQGCASGPWCLAVTCCHEASPLEVRLLPMKGKAIVQKHNHTGEMNQNQTEILWCPSPAGPRAAVGGSPLQNDYN